MGKVIRLTAKDGVEIGAWRADPTGTPKGAVVVLQEIFGVNSHIRNVCERFAAQGYVAVAPAIFDRQTPGFESGYSAEEIEKARKFLANLNWDEMLADTQAAIAEAGKDGLKVAVIGFCLGGSLAYLAGARLDNVAAAISYYGGQIIRFVDEAPKVPTLMHFGRTDHSIPMSDVEVIQAKRTDCDIHIFEAGHGFNCDERASYDEASALAARKLSLDFLAKHM